MEALQIEKLDTSLHNRKPFDCGTETLNIYLQTCANREQTKHLNVVYVLIDKETSPPFTVLGYYTLSNSAIALYQVENRLAKAIPPTYDIPTVKLGRLAVDKTLHGKQFGACLLKHALTRISDAADITGIRGIEVVAKDKAARGFYEKFGFIALIDSPQHLFLPIESIKT